MLPEAVQRSAPVIAETIFSVESHQAAASLR
jgi:hypothetical protein